MIRRHPTSESDSHQAASKRALSMRNGRWGTGGAKGKSKAARVTFTWRVGCAQKGGAQCLEGEGGESAQGPWHRRMPS